MRRHQSDGLRVVRVAEPGEIDIARVVVGQDDAAGFDIGQDKGVKRGGEVVGDDLQPDAASLGVQEFLVVGPSGRPAGDPIDDFHGAHHGNHALPATDTKRRIFLAERNLCLVNFDHASELGAVRVHHGSAQLGGEQPGGLVVDPELALELQGRQPVGVGAHQVGRPEPHPKRELGLGHQGTSGDRGLPTAATTLPKGTAVQPPHRGPLALGADEPVRPAPLHQILAAGLIAREYALELKQRLWKPFHHVRAGPRIYNPRLCPGWPRVLSLKHLPKPSAMALAPTILFYMVATKLLRKKIVWTIHDVNTMRPRYARLLQLYLLCVRVLVDAYVFMSPSSEAEFVKIFPRTRKKKVCHMPHGPYPVSATSRQRQAELTERLSWLRLGRDPVVFLAESFEKQIGQGL